MRILIDIGHPGHVHFFKHIIWKLEKRGHDILICARAKDLTIPLLEHYGFPYTRLSQMGKGLRGLAIEFLYRETRLLKIIRRFNPDLVTAIGGLFIAPACKLLNKPSIVFTDSEPVPLDKLLTYPFASLIYTPTSFLYNLGKHHRRYNGLHELAYLHPDYFRPDPAVLADLGVSENEPFIILRFVAWKATHDLGQQGFSLSFKEKLVRRLSTFARVFISSETPLPASLESFRIDLAPQKIHDALHYAALFMGDGATMATEAAILGTPAIRSSSMALNMGNFVDLMKRYQLVYSYYEAQEALAMATQLLRANNTKQAWIKKRDRLLAETIDVTKLVVDILEYYPISRLSDENSK